MKRYETKFIVKFCIKALDNTELLDLPLTCPTSVGSKVTAVHTIRQNSAHSKVKAVHTVRSQQCTH